MALAGHLRRGLLVVWVFFPWNRWWRVCCRTARQGAGHRLAKLSPTRTSARNSCRRSTKATCSTCRRPSPASRRPRRAKSSSRPTASSRPFPEVQHVFGKIGRAETATDPAPLDMIETTIMLKAEKEWPAVDIKDDDGKVIAHRRRTPDELVGRDERRRADSRPEQRLDDAHQDAHRHARHRHQDARRHQGRRAGPGRTGTHRHPRSRPSSAACPARRAPLPSASWAATTSSFDIDRDAIARYGLTIGDVQDVLEVALGGMPLTTTVEGLRALHRQPALRPRFPREPRRAARHRRAHARPARRCRSASWPRSKVVHAPMGIKSEGAVPNAWIYVDVKGMDVGTYVADGHARRATRPSRKGTIKLPSGYNIFWSGQYEYMLRAQQRLMIVVPLTLLIIMLIIYLNTRSAIKTAIVMLAVPFSLVGRVLDALPAALQPERGRLGRHHRAGRPRRGNRRRHAALPRPRLRRMESKGGDAQRRPICATPFITAR